MQQADEAFEYPAIDDSSQDNEQEGFKRVVENGYWGYLIHVTALRRVRGVMTIVILDRNDLYIVSANEWENIQLTVCGMRDVITSGFIFSVLRTLVSTEFMYLHHTVILHPC